MKRNKIYYFYENNWLAKRTAVDRFVKENNIKECLVYQNKLIHLTKHFMKINEDFNENKLIVIDKPYLLDEDDINGLLQAKDDGVLILIMANNESEIKDFPIKKLFYMGKEIKLVKQKEEMDLLSHLINSFAVSLLFSQVVFYSKVVFFNSEYPMIVIANIIFSLIIIRYFLFWCFVLNIKMFMVGCVAIFLLGNFPTTTSFILCCLGFIYYFLKAFFFYLLDTNELKIISSNKESNDA